MRQGVSGRNNARSLKREDYRLLAEFRYLLRQFLSFSEQAARGAGLAPQQHQALLAIKGFGGKFTVGDLADRLIIRHHSAVELVDRLVTAKFLRRITDGADRRRVFLALTPAAEDLLENLTTAHRDELRQLTRLLRPLITRLKN